MLVEDKLYTYMEVVMYLKDNRKGEIRLYVNIPGRKMLRNLMYDDGDRLYSINQTEHTYILKGRPVTKCIFNEGYVIPTIKVIEDDFAE